MFLTPLWHKGYPEELTLVSSFLAMTKIKHNPICSEYSRIQKIPIMIGFGDNTTDKISIEQISTASLLTCRIHLVNISWQSLSAMHCSQKHQRDSPNPGLIASAHTRFAPIVMSRLSGVAICSLTSCMLRRISLSVIMPVTSAGGS